MQGLAFPQLPALRSPANRRALFAHSDLGLSSGGAYHVI